MRCPDCNIRNSVAARVCPSCGHKFKRKPLPRRLIAGVALVVLVGAVWAAGAAIIPNLTDPKQRLAHLAKEVAAGPKSSADSKRMGDDFDQAVRAYLTKLGPLSTPDIVKKLQAVLPSSVYEVHSEELPRGLRLIEVDAVLQAADYLIMKGSSGSKVFRLPGMEVFDDARLINESAGPMLVVLGHSGGQPPHHPQVRAYALLPDAITDETEKLLPPIQGEGSARFVRNGRDIVLDISLLSLGQSEHLFAPVPQREDGTVHQVLEWKEAHYTSRYEYGSSPFTALYAVARCLRYPDLTSTHRQFLGSKGEELVRENKAADAGNFQVKRLGSTGDRISFLMIGNVGAFAVDVGKSNGVWSIVGTRNAPGEAARQGKGELQLAAQAPAGKPAGEKPAPSNQPNQAQVVERTNDAGDKKLALSTTHTGQAERSALEHKALTTHDKSSQKSLQQHESGAQGSAEQVHQQKSERLQTDTHHTNKTEAAAGNGQVNVAGTVNIRIGPTTEAKPVASVSKTDSMVILGKHNGWYKVRCQGQEGYIFAGLVDYKKSDAYTTATVTKSHIVTDKHKRPLSKSAVGDRVVIIGGLENKRYKVQLANGKTGYVDADAVNVTVDEPQFVP